MQYSHSCIKSLHKLYCKYKFTTEPRRNVFTHFHLFTLPCVFNIDKSYLIHLLSGPTTLLLGFSLIKIPEILSSFLHSENCILNYSSVS